MTTMENIAEAVRYPTRIESSPGMELIEQGRRLRASLKVAEKWIKATSAESGEPGEMWHQARYTYDRLEEELSRVPHEIEVAERAGVCQGGAPRTRGSSPRCYSFGHLARNLLPPEPSAAGVPR